MLKIENTEVMGWEHAIRGMRNPKNSWAKSDSGPECPYGKEKCCGECQQNFCIGPNDKQLMMALRNAGTDHRKFMRMITVYLDITAPLYWWKEFDTYKVGTVANSCSTMHKISAKPFSRDDFSCDRMDEKTLAVLDLVIAALEENRLRYNETKEKQNWHNMIQLLPSSYNQMRTVTLNYEVLSETICAVRCSQPLGSDWKKRIDEDYKRRK